MNIAFDCERMKYPHTGLFEYCHQLGMALRTFSGKEDEIQYYIRENDKAYFSRDSKFLTQHTLHKFMFPRYPNVDLWHITHQTSLYIPRSSRIKKVLTIHDLNFLYEEKAEWKQKKYLQKHQKNIDAADQLVAISEFTKKDILKHLKVDGKQISVIYNGCSDPKVSSGTQPAYLPSKRFLFALGTVNAKKNFHVLVPLLTGNDFELVIAGRIDPDYKVKIMTEATRFSVADRVKVIGPVSENDKPWYYKNCEAFLFPSLAEGFGIPPLEAMKFGKPTFLSNSTSLPEIGGEYAYYFDSYSPEDMREAFHKGMNDYDKTTPSEMIMKHASQFNWENSAKAYWDMYKEVLKS